MAFRALVTGVAGFVGSHLAESLVAEGNEVLGVDCFTDFYPRLRKEDNLAQVRSSSRFRFEELDLVSDDAADAVQWADVVFHQAAQAGVRTSWGNRFQDYTGNNVLATQRLLEAAKDVGVERFVYASSSSVYGDATSYPTEEDGPTRPFSPYGVTKLAAEHLCRLYAANFKVPTVSLRYFTVYGPRQRPDMAMFRMIQAALNGTSFPLYGAGEKIRDFTYVDDVVQANLLAASCSLAPGVVFNIAGGSNVSLRDVMEIVGRKVGRPVPVELDAAQPGDVARTGGATVLARQRLQWEPETGLEVGLEQQVNWQRAQRGVGT